MNVRCTVLVHGPPQQHLPRLQEVKICLVFHLLFPRVHLKSNPKKVKKEVQVKKEMQCYHCDYAVGGQRSVTCDICHAVYHMSCAKLRCPPKFGSWACESRVRDMIGSQ